jgi:3'-5' exoribonuclease
MDAASSSAMSTHAATGSPVIGEAAALGEPLPSAAAAPTIATLRPGQDVIGVYACTRKDRLVARTGTAYLALELRDATGAINARAFKDADALGARFERGDLVRVRGQVERFRDELQMSVADLRRATADEADPAAFLPSTYRDIADLDGYLDHVAAEVHDGGMRALLDALLGDDDLRAAWRLAPCTRAGHHAYLGGMLEHSVCVAQLAHDTCQLHPGLNSDLLITAAIVHDLGRTQEFTYGAEFGLTDAGRMLGHLQLGQRIVERAAVSVGLGDTRTLAVVHCLLGHHGPQVLPGQRFASAEALALYRINQLDAGVRGALEHGLGHEQ